MTTLSSITTEVSGIVLGHKHGVSDTLKQAGRSRLARLVLSLPCDEAPTIQTLAFQTLPISADALALAAASSAVLYTTRKLFEKACHAADIALIMLGPDTGAPLLSLISTLEQLHPPCTSTHSLMFAELDCLLPNDDLSDPQSVDLPSNLTRSTCDVLEDSTQLTSFVPYFEKDIPLKLPALANHWPACSKWLSPKYLADKHGHRVVPIEYIANGSSIMEEKFCTISQLLATIMNMKLDSSDFSSEATVYLAQHPIFNYIPSLESDIEHPSVIQVAGKSVADVVNIWMGSASSGSKLHYDSADNILVQLVGCKTVVLIPPSQTDCLYLANPTDNISPVDIAYYDPTSFPMFERVVGSTVTLRRGDALYIPARHWHWVQATTASISVNFWF